MISSRSGSTSFKILFDNTDKEETIEEECILILAPFTKTPRIDFGQLRANSNKAIVRLLAIQNEQSFDVDLQITCQDLEINNLKLSIPKKETVHLEIKWQPEREGSYKHAILFEVTNASRLKFIVHAFGVCLPAVKKARKPLAAFQPVVTNVKIEPDVKCFQ